MHTFLLRIELFFMLFLAIAPYAFAVGGLYFGVKYGHNYKVALAALEAYRKAADGLSAWFDRNPGVYMGLSDEARTLIRRCIDTNDAVKRACPELREVCEKHHLWLLSLFNHLPPKWPKSRPVRKAA